MINSCQWGRRLMLRRLGPEDRGAWLDLKQVSIELHRPWEPWPESGYRPPDANDFQSQLGRDAYLMIRRADNLLVGQVNFNQLVRGNFESAYLGYWVGQPFAGRGYATEGVALAVRHAFKVLRLHRLEANIVPTNLASLKVIQRCGFKKEGYSPRYLRIAGQWTDHERWALTVEDWKG